jgi:hypothetical protein
MLLIIGVDPANTVLADNYQAIVKEFRNPDPQPVPPELFDRLTVVDPRRALAASFWDVLAETDRDEPASAVRVRLAGPIAASLGAGFVGA